MTPIKVTHVRALGEYLLELSFSDGSSGVAPLDEDLNGPLAALRAPGVWQSAHVERGVVTWTGGLDLAPEFLYARAHRLTPPQSLADVEANQLELTLREVRAFAGRGPVDTHPAAPTSRDALEAVQQLVKSLGGEVEVVARFGDRSLRLHLP